MVRDGQGNCVPKTVPCEELGYTRNERGVCVPKAPREASRGPGQPGKDCSNDPAVEDFLKDVKKANDIWNAYYPGKGYGATEITTGSSPKTACASAMKVVGKNRGALRPGK